MDLEKRVRLKTHFSLPFLKGDSAIANPYKLPSTPQYRRVDLFRILITEDALNADEAVSSFTIG